MHQSCAKPKPHNGASADLVPGILELVRRQILPAVPVHDSAVMFLPGHDDTVARSHVVQEEITERMKRLLPKGVRDRECIAVDLCARERSG